MRVGIDGSGLLDGGGLTHLRGLLGAANPAAHGILEVLLWGARRTLDAAPDRPWLTKIHVPALEASLARRYQWQISELPSLLHGSCQVLFVPSGTSFSRFHPFVTMSRNMLPFDIQERARYGISNQFLRLQLLRYAQAATFRRADGLIFLSEYARREVLQQVGPSRAKIVTIPHGISETFRFAPRPQRAASRLAEEAPLRWCYVSAVEVYKHQWQVAEAAGRLRGAGLPISVDFIGPGSSLALERLRTAIDRIDPQGRFLRHTQRVPHSELPGVYQQAEAFVFASSCENMPNILVEAMAAGLPIASSNRGPMPELLGEGGAYFDPECPEQIANAMERLCRSAELRAECASVAYERARRYSWTRCAEETFAFLREVGIGHN